jgi:hypothetical protein
VQLLNKVGADAGVSSKQGRGGGAVSAGACASGRVAYTVCAATACCGLTSRSAGECQVSPATSKLQAPTVLQRQGLPLCSY